MAHQSALELVSAVTGAYRGAARLECPGVTGSQSKNMSDPQLTLGWDRPFMDGAATHVTLYAGGTGPLYVVASGHGSDERYALRDLWAALIERNESAEYVAFVADQYEKMTGKTLRK